MIYVVPQLGYVTKVLQPPVNYIIIVIVIGIMVAKQLKNREKSRIPDSAEGLDELPSGSEDAYSQDTVGDAGSDVPESPDSGAEPDSADSGGAEPERPDSGDRKE